MTWLLMAIYSRGRRLTSRKPCANRRLSRAVPDRGRSRQHTPSASALPQAFASSLPRHELEISAIERCAAEIEREFETPHADALLGSELVLDLIGGLPWWPDGVRPPAPAYRRTDVQLGDVGVDDVGRCG